MISGLFGLPGSGKSVTLVKAVDKALHGKPFKIGGHYLHTGKYDHILTNFPMSGCDRLEWDTLGKVELRNCLIVCDEIMLYADSRKYKTFSDDLTFFFAEHRHFDIDFIYASQTYRDCDIRIRNLTQRFYLCEPAPVFGDRITMTSPIKAGIRVDGDIKEGYVLERFPHVGFCWMPHYWDMYDTKAIIGHGDLEKPVLQPW